MSDGTTTWNYTYNADGMRTSRTNGQKTYTYTYDGDKLTYMTVNGYLHLYFAYDASGVPMSVTYNGTTYYYVTNVQGDVIGILDSTGAQVATYAYDAWGNPLPGTESQTSEIGTLNPLRYRGYVWDSETELYYLQSRYYNPEIGRFINADAYASTGQDLLGNNMFAYCNNNPIRFFDPTGFCACIGTRLSFIDCGDWRCPTSSAELDSLDDYQTTPTKEMHYSRNQYNPTFPEYFDAEYFEGWDNTVSANCHQFTAENRDNVKYVSPDGMYEVIYDVDGKLVSDPKDVGTYNYISPNKDGLGHFIQDVVPWLIYGNSPDDTTKWWQRILSLGKLYV